MFLIVNRFFAEEYSTFVNYYLEINARFVFEHETFCIGMDKINSTNTGLEQSCKMVGFLSKSVSKLTRQ